MFLLHLQTQDAELRRIVIRAHRGAIIPYGWVLDDAETSSTWRTSSLRTILSYSPGEWQLYQQLPIEPGEPVGGSERCRELIFTVAAEISAATKDASQ